MVFFFTASKKRAEYLIFFHFKLSYMINWWQNFLSFNSACNHTRHLNKSDSHACFNTLGRIIYLLIIQWNSFRACLHGGGGGPQVGEVTCGRSPHLSWKRDQIKMRDYMAGGLPPPKRVTSPTWGFPTPCKQALILDSTQSYYHYKDWVVYENRIRHWLVHMVHWCQWNLYIFLTVPHDSFKYY